MPAIKSFNWIVSLSPRLKISKSGPSYFERRHHALDDVVDVSVIAPRRAIAELIDRFARVDASW